MAKIGRHLRHIGYLIGGVVLLESLLGAQLVDAATYYVATTGNDANPGTEAAPFRTVNKGVKGRNPGDTLYVKSGTYAESLQNTIPGGTSWSLPVTVAAYPGHTVTLRPPAGTGNVLVFSGSSKQYIIVKGFILDAINVGGNGIAIGAGSTIGAAHHIRILNCEVKNAPVVGILVNVGTHSNEFINLNLHDNGTDDADHGIYIKSSYNLVEHSRIYRNAGWGVHVYWAESDPIPVNNNIIRNNKIYQNARVGNRGAGIILSSGSGNMAYNNLIWGNYMGIQVQYHGVSNTKVYNNTVYANRTYGIFIGSASSTSVRNNIVYGNASTEIINHGSGTLLSNNLVDIDPKFVNAAAYDLRLQASSPAINNGMPLSEVPKDFAEVSRPQGGSYDIGGYEYTSSTNSALMTTPMNLRVINPQ